MKTVLLKINDDDSQISANYKTEVLNLDSYRKFELAVFYSQLISIILYIIYCKMFNYLKERFNQIDKNDPFQNLIRDTHRDFLEEDNFFQNTQILQIMSITISIYLT